MQIAAVFVFALLTLLPGRASLTGTWSLDRTKSDFGKADTPRIFVVQLEQMGDRLDAAILSADVDGERVSYRECRVQTQLNGTLACISDGVKADETWQITALNELSITRIITKRSQAIRQRLVLARSTRLE